jgi:DNA-binding GntR family transcriptional regulator
MSTLNSSFQSIDAKTLRKDVTTTIREAIFNGELAPGQRVNQAHIAEQLGISRGPVREALAKLEEEGLICNIPYKGTFVVEITKAYIQEVFSIRRVLEGFAIRRASNHATPEELKALRNVVTKMQQASGDMSNREYSSELDLTFHRLICQSAHHGLLLQMWKSIEGVLRLYLSHRHRVVYEDPRHIVDTHPDILAAIETGDPDRAASLLDSHIQEAEEAIHNSDWLKL